MKTENVLLIGGSIALAVYLATRKPGESPEAGLIPTIRMPDIGIDFPEIRFPDIGFPDIDFPDIDFPDIGIPDFAGMLPNPLDIINATRDNAEGAFSRWLNNPEAPWNKWRGDGDSEAVVIARERRQEQLEEQEITGLYMQGLMDFYAGTLADPGPVPLGFKREWYGKTYLERKGAAATEDTPWWRQRVFYWPGETRLGEGFKWGMTERAEQEAADVYLARMEATADAAELYPIPKEQVKAARRSSTAVARDWTKTQEEWM